MRSTNKEWRKTIDYVNYTVYSVNEEMLGDIVATLEKIDKPISLDLRKNTEQYLPSLTAKLTRLTNLTGLSIEAISTFKSNKLEDWLVLTVLSNLKRLVLPNAPLSFQVSSFPNLESAIINAHKDYKTTIAHMTKLQQLEFHPRVGLDLTPFSSAIMGFKNLTLLEIYDGTPNFHKDVQKILDNLDGLKQFAYDGSATMEGASFSLKNLTRLEGLSIFDAKFSSLNSTRLQRLAARQINYNEIEEYLPSMVNLKRLYLGFEDDENDLTFLTTLTALEKLQLLNEDCDENLCSILANVTWLTSLAMMVFRKEHFGELYPALKSLKRLAITLVESHEIDLSGLTNLQNLQLEYSTSEYITFPPNLTYLSISDSGDGDEPERNKTMDLSNLPNLVHLEVYRSNQFIGLETLTTLTYLDLSQTDLDIDLQFVSHLTNLRQVISRNERPILSYLVNATNLQYLTVSLTISNTEALDQLANFQQLTHLSILEYLWGPTKQKRSLLLDTPITKLSNLQYLHYGDNSGIRQFQKFMPRLWNGIDLNEQLKS